jgi:hypothetical protein
LDGLDRHAPKPTPLSGGKALTSWRVRARPAAEPTQGKEQDGSDRCSPHFHRSLWQLRAGALCLRLLST